MKFNNKKGEVMFILVRIIILIISFFILAGVINVIFNEFDKKSDDFKCRTVINMKGNSFVSLVEYIHVLNQKCDRVDKTIKEDKKEKVFEELALMSKSCWYRYGDGEVDFLEKYKETGNWCFLCGVASIKDTGVDKNYKYNNFVEWINDPNNLYDKDEKIPFKDVTNFKYVDTSKNLDEFKSDLDEFVINIAEDGDAMIMSDLVLGLEYKYETISDYKSKTFNSGEDYYVVYRFDRFDKSLTERINDLAESSKDAAYFAIGGAIALDVGSGAVISGLSCASTGIGIIISPFCAIGGAIGSVVKSTFTTIKSFDKVMKIGRIFSKTKDIFKFTSRAKKSQEITKVVLKSGDSYKFVKSISKMKKVTSNQILEVSKIFEKISPTLSKNFKELSVLMKKLNLDEIDLNTLKKADMKTLENLVKTDIPLNKLKGFEGFVLREDLLKLQRLAKNSLGKGKLSIEEATTVKDYIKVLTVISFGTIGAILPEEGKNDQYVDIMSKEQYYRLCGTAKAAKK